ncbi:hypothetical protein [Streptomyces sp. NPDC002067]
MADGGERDRGQVEAGQAIDRLGTADEIARAASATVAASVAVR